MMHCTNPRFVSQGLFLLVGFLSILGGPRDHGLAEDRRPNVVILFTDDQGTLDAGCYGSKDLYTPNMDRLAQSGVRFTQAYAHIVCCPSRAMLLTGRHPQRCNVNSWQQGDAKGPPGLNMLLSETTIAEALKTVGYRTALFGKWHLGAAYTNGPTKQGFDEFFGIRDGFIDNYNHFFLHGSGYHDLYRGTNEVFARDQYFPDLMTAEAFRFIDENRQRPFFLYVPFNIPHYPEQADKTFDARYKNLPEPRQSYAKILSTTDDRMGQILKRLDQHGLSQNTIVIFMSDNGHSAEDYQIKVDQHTSGYPKGHNYGAKGGGGNTGKWRGHKGQFFEGGIRVPAVIRYPAGLPQGLVRDQVITACDWYPTILELCNVKNPVKQLDGASLLPIIQDNAASHHQVMHWQWQNRWAVRDGDWKLIRDRGKLFLGNLADDQPEVKNYATEKPAVVTRLTALHMAWSKEVKP